MRQQHDKGSNNKNKYIKNMPRKRKSKLKFILTHESMLRGAVIMNFEFAGCVFFFFVLVFISTVRGGSVISNMIKGFSDSTCTYM